MKIPSRRSKTEGGAPNSGGVEERAYFGVCTRCGAMLESLDALSCGCPDSCSAPAAPARCRGAEDTGPRSVSFGLRYRPE